MSIVSKFLQIFKRDIKITNKAQDQLVTVSNTSGIIKVGSHLTVPEGFVAIICTKGKLCDIFTSGEYDLEPGLMRKATKVRKLTKPDRKGKLKTKFKGFVYFINLKEFNNQVFESYNGVITKQPKLFKTMVTLNGTFSFKISNPKKFMQTLISIYYNVSGELPLQQVKLWAGEYADKFVQSKKLIFEYFLSNLDIINDGSFEYMKKEFDTVGIELISFKIENVFYPKSIKRKIDGGKIFFSNMEKVMKEENEKQVKLQEIQKEKNEKTASENQLDENQQEEFSDNLFEENAVDENLDNQYSNENVEEESKSTENNLQDLFNKQDATDYLASNFNTDYVYSNQASSELNSDASAYSQIYDSLQSNNDLGKEEEKTIDKNADEVDNNANSNEVENDFEVDDAIKSEVKYKVCENCGANNPLSSKKCFNCKQEFCKVCNTCGEKVKNGEFVCPKCGTIII